MMFKDCFELDQRKCATSSSNRSHRYFFKSVTSSSLEEVIKSLSELVNSQLLKLDEGEVIDRGSTAEGSHLNLRDFRCAERLRRYACVFTCCVADM